MAKAKGSGRKKGGWMRVRKTREVKPDGAHAYSWAYQARIADALAAKRDAERTTQAAAEEASAAEHARAKKASASEAAEAKRRAQLAPRPCLVCTQILPPEAFERHARAYNGRMGACRPCAKKIRDRRTAPQGRRATAKEPLPPRPCRYCETLFVPANHRLVFCADGCRDAHGRERHRKDYYANWDHRRRLAEEWKRANPEKRRCYRRKAYHARPEAEKAAHAQWVSKNRERVNAYQRQFWHRCNADRTWRVQNNAAKAERYQRRQAINAAKAEFVENGFLLVRARSGFWRSHQPGQAIGQTETIMARYDWSGGAQWCVRPPAIATEAVRQVAAWLRQGEEKQRQKKR